ncbi:hypothetical protein [Clostridium sp.]|uniref:hypothetical protein n=1 Tax=Clostridium sp. TaxID=1506 RepID=UPI0034648386
MDNTIKNEEIKDKPKNYKKDYLIGLIMLIAFMFLQLFFSGFYDIYADSPLFWIIFMVAGITFHRKDWKEYMLLIFPVLNYFLFKFFYIFIPNYIVIFIVVAVLTIFYAVKENSDKKKIKIALVIVLGIVLFPTNYYLYSNRIIKDGNLEAEIKRSQKIYRPAFLSLKEDELNKIDKISIGASKKVKNLSGIEKMNSVKQVGIDDDGFIMSYSPLLECKNLKILIICDSHLKKLGEVGTFDNLEELVIDYVKKGSLADMPYFPDVKNLDIRTKKPINLSGLKNFPKVEKFSLTVTGVPSFDGIENLTNLKELILYDKVIENYDKLLSIPTLKKISLYLPLNVNEEFINAAKAKGIEIEILEESKMIFE